MLCDLYCFAWFLDQAYCIEEVWNNPLNSLNLPAQKPMGHCRNCGWCVSSMGAAAQEHPQEAAQAAQGQHRPTELQISSTENITSSFRIENISGGQLTPSPLHVSLSRWKVESEGWTFLPSGPPCYLLAFLGAWMWHLLSCFWCDAPGHGLMEPKLDVLWVPVPAVGCKCSRDEFAAHPLPLLTVVTSST